MVGAAVQPSEEGAIVAYGLLVCVATICVAYLVLRAWPRRHYPRFFAVLAGVATVAGMYVLQVPGAGFGLAALFVLMYLSLYAADSIGLLFEEGGTKPGGSSPTNQVVATQSVVWPFSFGALLGGLVSLLAVSALLVPPHFLKRWVFHPEPLHERIERALNPGEQWTSLRDREREATEGLKRTLAELAVANKRLSDTEGALDKARDELGVTTSNTVRGIKIKDGNGSRHVNGAIYIGVLNSVSSGGFCSMSASSDKMETGKKYLHPGEAVTLQSSRGKHRVVLTGLDRNSCTFDLVKD